jgi:hypothetical protein
MAAGRNAVLVAVTSGSAKVGLVLFEMRKTAARVAEIMDGDVASMIEPEPESELENAGAEPQPPATAEQVEAPAPAEAPEIPDPVNDFGDVPSHGNGVAEEPRESAISTWH